MDLNAIRTAAREAMAGRRTHVDRPPGYVLAHGQRVARIALDLARELTQPSRQRPDAVLDNDLDFDLDPDVLYAGALLHDLGRGLGAEDRPHEAVGAGAAAALLAPFATPDEVARVVHIVAHHNHRTASEPGRPPPPAPYAPAVLIVQDADSLDHVGPIGVWMATYHAAALRGTLDDALAYARSPTQTADRAQMRRELNYALARRRFDARVAHQQRILRDLASASAPGPGIHVP
jgi:HD superfamily phosphodiesterase